MTMFPTLINAALEFIEEKLDSLHENTDDLTTPEDVASVRREQALMEQEIESLGLLLDVARALAKMQHVQIEKLLRQTGRHEATDRVTALALAVAALDEDGGPQKEDD
jgi:hypothetical protein